jgi:hypothetical protein
MGFLGQKFSKNRMDIAYSLFSGLEQRLNPFALSLSKCFRGAIRWQMSQTPFDRLGANG